MIKKFKDLIQIPGVASLLLLVSLCLLSVMASSKLTIVVAIFLTTIAAIGIHLWQLTVAARKSEELHCSLNSCMPYGLLDVWKAFEHPNGSTVIEDANGALVATFEESVQAIQVCALRHHLNDRYIALRS